MGLRLVYHKNGVKTFLKSYLKKKKKTFLKLIVNQCPNGTCYHDLIGISNSLPHKIYCENIVDVALLLFLLNFDSYDSQIMLFNIFIKVVKIS